MFFHGEFLKPNVDGRCCAETMFSIRHMLLHPGARPEYVFFGNKVVLPIAVILRSWYFRPDSLICLSSPGF